MKGYSGLSIVIVSHNHRDYLLKCLESLFRGNHNQDYKIIVVDNNSSDGTVESLPFRVKSKITVIRNKTNIGFAKACNLGINFTSSSYYLMLNPDIIVNKGSVERLLEFLKKNKSVACVVPLLKNLNGSIQYSCRKFPGWRETLLKRTPIRWFINLEDINKYDVQTRNLIDSNIPLRIDWALGGCMMIKKLALEKIGLFDERFFLYCEDIDLFYRLKQKGLIAYCLPESIMHHKHLAVSDNNFFSIESYHHFIGIMRFIVKHFNDILTGRYQL